MTNQSFASDIRRYAIAGAQARLDEITQELEAIRRAFPELRQNGSSGARTRQSAVIGGDESASLAPRRRRSTMSAAQRKAVGERMKKYWAARRGGSQASSASDSPETAAPAQASRAKTGATAKRGPRTMSPEARKRISDAQKARWAKQRGGAGTAGSDSAKTSAKARQRGASKRTSRRTEKRGARKLSAAARKRMSEAQKKRWAAKRKAA